MKIKQTLKFINQHYLLIASITIIALFSLVIFGFKTYQFVKDPVNVNTIPESIVVPHITPKVERKEVKPVSVKEQILKVAKDKNFKWPEYLIRLAACESGLNPEAVNSNSNGTADKGVFQINDVHNIPDHLRFDVKWATEWSINKINEGSQGIWVCDSKVKSNPQKYDKIAGL